MSRVCLLVHDLADPSAPAADGWIRHGWLLAAALAEAGSETTLLHTGPGLDRERHGLRHAARERGATYRHLEEFVAFSPLAILPAVPAHRTGLHVSSALGALAPDTLIVLDHPAHAAAALGARACGLAAAPGRLVLALATTGEFRRERAAQFPRGGRADLGADFLERAAIAGADSILCGEPALLAWLRFRSSSLPADTRLLAPLVAGSDAAQRAAWCAAAAPAPPRPAPGALPSVAVCVPYYEQPKYLREALTLLAEQSAAPQEVIVVDDGSASPAAREAFAAAAAQFARPGWRFLQQDNAGPAAARNRAAAEATADVLIFCDADNRFRPEMTAILARAMQATGADCVTCGFAAFPDPGEENPDHPAFAYVPLGPCLELALIENILGDTNFAVRRSVFQALGGFPVDNRAASEDWQFLLQLVRRGRALGVAPALLFDYRLAGASHARRHSEFASARAAVGPSLAAADPAWRRLWPHVAGLVRDPRLARAEAELEDARIKFARTEDLLRQRDRLRRGHVVLVERELQRRREEVRLAQAAAAEQWRKNAQLAEQTSSQIDRLERAGRLQEDKIRRMQASFSWRATAVLRALRRILVDRRPAAGAAPAAPAVSAPTRHYRHHLDAPRHWTRLQSEVTVRGWCFAEEPGSILAIRARIGARTYPGAYGGERPDLPVAFPQWPQSARGGFKIEVLLLPDDESASLEVQVEDGSWESFLTHPLSPAAEASLPGSYEHWLRAHDQPSASQLAALAAAGAALAGAPVVSVLMPVYNAEPRWLERAIASVRGQTYPHWELCIADDASSDPRVRPLLERFRREEARIKVVFRDRNGHISAATNSALALATGDYAALFDQDDELAPHALSCVAAELAAHPDAELVYTDEDKIDEQGARFDPHFKPDWNPDLLPGQNYISHLAVVRTGRLRELGGLREGFEGSQDWDLFLRVTEQIPAAAIRHVPRVLYHWRANEGSTALHLGEKDYAQDAARRALTEHFGRRGIAVQIVRRSAGIGGSPTPCPRSVRSSRSSSPRTTAPSSSGFAWPRFSPAPTTPRSRSWW